MGEAELVLARIEERRMKCFALPISRNFIVAHFGTEAFQLPSGQSVVIANSITKKVYKYCLNDADALTLMNLYLLGRLKPERSSSQSQ